MTLVRPFRLAAALLLVGLLFAVTATAAFAQQPVPVVGPRLKPPPIPHSWAADKTYITPTFIYNQPRVPQNAEARAWYIDQGTHTSGAGVSKTVTSISNGLTLYKNDNVSYNFNDANHFSGNWSEGKTDIWTESYTDWGTFAVDDYLRQARNVTFSRERSIGPGKNYGASYSLKIASNQPYAGGWGSPVFEVAPNTDVTVTVKYLIYNWTQVVTANEVVHDWASLGLKASPESAESTATYANGYHRGEWATLKHSVTVGDDGLFMIFLQGESTGAVNSNIYFDDVLIEFTEKPE